MSDHLLLTDKTKCPKCRHHSVPYLPCQCRSCGMNLFEDSDSYESFMRETCWREIWVYFRGDGWVHSTHIKVRKALSRHVIEEKLPDNYGTPEFVKDKISNSRIELREALKKAKVKGKIIKSPPPASDKAVVLKPLAAQTE